MSLRETREQRLHTLLASLVPLRSKSKTLIGPAYGHVFGSDSVEAEVTSIRVRCEVQRTMIRFDPLTVRADRVITGSSATAESCNNNDQEEQARHGNLTPEYAPKFRR